jgi:hypothetical protein
MILSFQNGFFWQDIFSNIKVPSTPPTGTGAEIIPLLLSLIHVS